MAHPLSTYLSRPRRVDKRKRRCLVRTFWLIGVVDGRGHWWPQNFPPVTEGDAEKVAKNFADERTRMSGRKHEARQFFAENSEKAENGDKPEIRP